MIGQYWHTIRHLRAAQIYGRLQFRLLRPKPVIAAAPPLRAHEGRWRRPACRRPSLRSPTEFLLLNKAGSLTECGWDGPGCETLWRYNQHYFDDLNALDAPARKSWHIELLNDWIESNPPASGVGWEPYPTSLRIVNWIKWSLAGNELSQLCRDSLATQARWLMKRLEWHLLGNHLFSNAKALVFAGLWFDGPEAELWLEKGLEILAREVQEQILPDGGQFELSPMYHTLALEDMLDLLNVTQAYTGVLSLYWATQVQTWTGRIPLMLSWLHAMCHPDGEIAFFNDAALGVAPTPKEVVAYAERLGFDAAWADAALIWLKNSGYARFTQPEALLLVDMAHVGPDYLPGHAHADTLSFELSLFGQRVFINSGTSVYGLSEERMRQRGTAAHNTVILANCNSSDVWSGFRVGRRASPLNAHVARDGNVLVALAAHDGYNHLAGHPLHYRSWRLSEDELIIEDNVTAPTTCARARYHLHPDVAIQQNTASSGTLALPSGKVTQWTAEGGAVTLELETWHPEFGKSLPTTCLDISLKEGRSKLSLTWR